MLIKYIPSFSKYAAMALTLLASSVMAEEEISLRLGDVKGDRYASLVASGELESLPYKLELTTFAAGAPVLEALNAGALDVGFTGDIPFLFVRAAGAPVKAVGAWRYNTETVAIVVNGDSDIERIQDLAGKRIAVNRGGWGHFMALGALERAEMSIDDVEFAFLGPVDGRAALNRHSVDAWVPWEPYTSSAILLDNSRVIETGDGIMTGYSYALAHEDAIESKQEAIQDLLLRLARAQQWALENPNEFSQQLANTLELPIEVTERWVAQARISPATIDSDVINSLQVAADFFHRHEVLPVAVDVSDAFDTSFATWLRAQESFP